MITCDACGKAPERAEPKDPINLTEIAMTFAPPPGLGLTPIHLCWACTGRLYKGFVEILAGGVDVSNDRQPPWLGRGSAKG